MIMKIHFAYIAIILCFISCQKQIMDSKDYNYSYNKVLYHNIKPM